MLDVFDTYATDETKEVEGVAVDMGNGAFITVARINNDRYLERILAESEKYKEQLALKTDESKELDKKITVEVLADTVLLGFTGLSFKGQALNYSKANAIKFLRVKDFRKKVMEEAGKFENFKATREARDIKNS